MLNVRRSIRCVHKPLQLIGGGLGEPGKPGEPCRARPSLAKVNLKGRALPPFSFLGNALQAAVKRDGFAADDTVTENCSAKYVE